MNPLVVGRQWQRGLPATTILWAASWLSFPVILMAVSILQAGQRILSCHPFHCSHAEGPGICPPVFLGPQARGGSSLEVVWTTWGNCSPPPHLTFMSHDWVLCSRLVLVAVVAFPFPCILGWCCFLKWLVFFLSVLHQGVSMCHEHITQPVPSLGKYLNPKYLNPRQDVCPRYLHNGAFLLPHLYKFVEVECVILTPLL